MGRIYIVCGYSWMAGVVESTTWLRMWAGSGSVCVGRMVGGTLVDGSFGRCASGDASEKSMVCGIGASARVVI